MEINFTAILGNTENCCGERNIEIYMNPYTPGDNFDALVIEATGNSLPTPYRYWLFHNWDCLYQSDFDKKLALLNFMKHCADDFDNVYEKLTTENLEQNRGNT